MRIGDATPGRLMPWTVLGLTIWLVAAPAFGYGLPEPPELSFGTPVAERLRFTRPLSVRSGDYVIELLGVDRLRPLDRGQVRLLGRCSAADGAPLPEDLVLLGPVLALDDQGRSRPVLSAEVYRDSSALWLSVIVDAGDRGKLAVFGAAVGPRPVEQTLRRRLPLHEEEPPQPVTVDDTLVLLSMARRETYPLVVESAGPPGYYAIDSTQYRTDEPPPATEATPYQTLRLHLLAPTEPDGWRLTNLRLLSAGDGAGQAAVDDWRYVRRDWRPDWGGWLGCQGRDWSADSDAEAPADAADTAPKRGVEVVDLAPDSPAAALLRPGDLVVAVDGQPVIYAYDLGAAVRRRAPDTTLPLTVWRDGHMQELRVPLGQAGLWPEVDPLEFEQAWSALHADADNDRVLSQWDWQTRAPLPAGFEPRAVELIFTRLAPTAQTMFQFQNVPLRAP